MNIERLPNNKEVPDDEGSPTAAGERNEVSIPEAKAEQDVESREPAESPIEHPSHREATPEETLADISKRLEGNQTDIDRLKASIAERRAKLMEAARELGLPPGVDDSPSLKAEEESLGKLEETARALQEERGRLETNVLFNEILEQLNNMPKQELKIIIETGKNNEGNSFKDRQGREVDPEVVKKLAQLAYDGVKKLTAALFGALFGLIGGIASAIKGLKK